MLNPVNTTAFFEAATQGQDITLNRDGAIPFRVSWPPYWSSNHFSNISASARLMYLPSADLVKLQDKNEGHVRWDQIVLLNEPSRGKSNLELTCDFVKRVQSVVAASVPVDKPAVLPGGCGIVVELRIPKTGPDSFNVKGYFSQSQETPKIASALLQPLQKVLQELEAPEGLVYDDYIKMQLLCSCWGFNWRLVRPGKAPF